MTVLLKKYLQWHTSADETDIANAGTSRNLLLRLQEQNNRPRLWACILISTDEHASPESGKHTQESLLSHCILD